MNRRKLERHLRSHGCLLHHNGGKHDVWVNSRTLAPGLLEGVAERLRAQALRVQARVVVDAQPAVAIQDQAQASPSGVIALATHGRGGLARALLGSTADKVIRGTTTPVFVWRPRN